MPLIEGVLELAGAGHATGGGGRNRDASRMRSAWDPGVPAALAGVLADPQTSGGLLLAVSAERLDDLVLALAAAGAGAHVVGVLHAGAPGRIVVGGPRPA